MDGVGVVSSTLECRGSRKILLWIDLDQYFDRLQFWNSLFDNVLTLGVIINNTVIVDTLYCEVMNL